MDQALNDLKGYVAMAAAQGFAAHEVEADIWRRVLRRGHQAMGLLFHLVGTGEVGESTVLPEGREGRRLEGRHARAYQSVFGYFEVERSVYGSREGQKIEYVPVDTPLQLPESAFSYLLQDGTQGLAVEHAYRHVPETLGRILDVKPTVDRVERMNQKMAQSVRGFRQSRPAPEPESEGALCGVSADGKGVPMRRHAPEVPIAAHDRDPKPKTNRKKMAVVGAVYTMDPFVRTPEESVDSLVRDRGDEPLSIKMERSGMRWTLERAQAMLDVRSTYVNGDWDAFMAYRIEKETQRLYPHRALVEPIDMPEKSEMPIAA